MRIKTGYTRHKRHKALLKRAKGFRLSRGKLVSKAKEGLLHAGRNAYRDRRKKKRVVRSLWIERLNGALSSQGINYSRFIALMKTKKININRKILSEIAISDPNGFSQIVASVKT